MTGPASPSFEPTFRHAVCLVDPNGRHLPHSRESQSLAAELLVEYAAARGGAPIDGKVWVRYWNYGHCTGYGMEFVGGPTEPAHATRLIGEPCCGMVMLEGREEQYRVPEPQS